MFQLFVISTLTIFLEIDFQNILSSRSIILVLKWNNNDFEIPSYRNKYKMQQILLSYKDLMNGYLKGESQGDNAIFKGLKMFFITKILKKKNYTTLIASKKLQSLFWHLFFTALLIAVKLNFSNAPRAQDNLSKLLTELSA